MYMDFWQRVHESVGYRIPRNTVVHEYRIPVLARSYASPNGAVPGTCNTSKGERLRFNIISEFLYSVYMNKNINISVPKQTDILCEVRGRDSYTLFFVRISELTNSDF
jgi:hypothetical protein